MSTLLNLAIVLPIAWFAGHFLTEKLNAFCEWL